MYIFIAKGGNIALPTLTKHRGRLKPGRVFKEVKLIEGWIATKNLNGNYTWTLQSNAEIKKTMLSMLLEFVFCLKLSKSRGS